jgi:hypothetical protein
LPGLNFCAPATRLLSTITPKIWRLPPASWAAMSRATSSWRWCCLLELAWLQSTIRLGCSLAASSSAQAALTCSAS